MQRHQGAKCKHFDVSDVIYHKFSHDAASYTVNGENVNVVLELCIKMHANYSYCSLNPDGLLTLHGQNWFLGL